MNDFTLTTYNLSKIKKRRVYMATDDRQKALDRAMKQITKDFGKGSIMRLGDEPSRKIDTISSGSLALDVALGVGGYPRGRVIEI